MNLFKLNDRETGRPVWVNLDHVTDMRATRGYDANAYTRIHILHGVKSIAELTGDEAGRPKASG